VVLPLAAWSETSGSLTNIEGIVQHCAQAVTPNTPLSTVQDYLERLV